MANEKTRDALERLLALSLTVQTAHPRALLENQLHLSLVIQRLVAVIAAAHGIDCADLLEVALAHLEGPKPDTKSADAVAEELLSRLRRAK